MEQRIRELVDKLNEYSKAYYVLDAPKISDKEYDELYDELLRLNPSPVIELNRAVALAMRDGPWR